MYFIYSGTIVRAICTYSSCNGLFFLNNALEIWPKFHPVQYTLCALLIISTLKSILQLLTTKMFYLTLNVMLY